MGLLMQSERWKTALEVDVEASARDVRAECSDVPFWSRQRAERDPLAAEGLDDGRVARAWCAGRLVDGAAPQDANTFRGC